jgi:hypothetical protein
MTKETGSVSGPRRRATTQDQADTGAADKSSSEPSGTEESADEEQRPPEAPTPGLEELERLRARLIAKYYGWRR